MPSKVPKLILTSAKAASVTYSFVTEGDETTFRSWALCTVNDQTGELFITSDWGSWSHRWHASPEALGAPTLTAFIGGRSDVDYLARKLQNEGRAGVRFSSTGTVRELRRLLCARRLEDGREQFERRLEPEDFVDGQLPGHLMLHYTESGLPLLSHRSIDSPTWQEPTRKEYLPYLTADAARGLWDSIEGAVGECSPNRDLVFDRLRNLPGFVEFVTDEPWHHAVSEQTPEDKALRDIVLPALIQACKDATAALTVEEPVSQEGVMNPVILKFVGHHDHCDWLQPMYHKGPCDCGLHAALDSLLLEDLAVLEVERPPIVAGWRESKT